MEQVILFKMERDVHTLINNRESDQKHPWTTSSLALGGSGGAGGWGGGADLSL